MFTRQNFSLLGAFVFLALTTSCASNRLESAGCDQKDWYELGRSDGSTGAPAEKLANYKNKCDADFKADWETMYMNGRNAGLVEFCESENGYELGRAGSTYFYVCPSTMETAFLDGYRRGQKARELELEIQKLDAKIDTIAQQLVAMDSSYDRNVLSSEMEQLKRLRLKNDRQLERMSKQ